MSDFSEPDICITWAQFSLDSLLWGDKEYGVSVSSSKPTLNPQRWIGQTSFSHAVSTHRSTWWWHLQGCTWATEGEFEVRFLSSAESIEKTVEIFILLLKTLLNWSNFHQQQGLRTERVAIERWDLVILPLSDQHDLSLSHSIHHTASAKHRNFWPSCDNCWDKTGFLVACCGASVTKITIPWPARCNCLSGWWKTPVTEMSAGNLLY